MDESCIDESASTESPSNSPSPPPPPPPFSFPATKSPPSAESLCRVGSGTSVIVDSENGIEAESRKLSSSRFKGVVPQPNGRWGAQIYEKHQRVWLGTFNEENEAAKAYDTAAQRFRGRDAVTNFKPLAETDEDEIESAFLFSRSKAEIVDMLRKHTYNDELEQSKRNHGFDRKRSRNEIDESDLILKARESLFEKSVTPSDVGKLNRLVIPKQHAEKHFPLQNGSITKGVLLNFEDVGGKVWRFRYSYWNSSQSYVLTRGWSRFVKEKNLKAGDTVSFHRSSGPEKQLFIDWKVRTGSHTVSPISIPIPIPIPIEPIEMVRLFGVNIVKIPGNGGVEGINGGCNGRRMREMELLAIESGKKQRMIGGL